MFLLSLLISSLTFAAEPAAPAHTTAPAVPPAMTAPETGAPVDGAVKVAKVMFVEPKDGATVAKTFKVKFAVEGMKIADAGKVTPGTGHFHLVIDGAAVTKGQAIPKDDKHRHFEKAESETELTLKPGQHTLTLQFADGAQLSYGDMMSQTIHIKVK